MRVVPGSHEFQSLVDAGRGHQGSKICLETAIVAAKGTPK
jgi:hypothetical protein